MAAPHVAGAAALAKAAFPTSPPGLKAFCRGEPSTPRPHWTRRVQLQDDRTPARRFAARRRHRYGSSHRSPRSSSLSASRSRSPSAARCGDLRRRPPLAQRQLLALAARGDGQFGSFYADHRGPVTIASASAAANGVTDTRSVSGTAIRNYPIAPDGSPLTVTTTAAGENASLVFEGSTGQRISLKVGSVTFGTLTCCR